jgi:hypothetical protein
MGMRNCVVFGGADRQKAQPPLLLPPSTAHRDALRDGLKGMYFKNKEWDDA